MISQNILFVSNGNAKSKDREFNLKGKKQVHEKTGVNLEIEINIVMKKKNLKRF